MKATWINYLPIFVRRRLEGRYNLQMIIDNTGWLFVDKILRMGVGLFVVVWIARYLGPEEFGLYNYAVAFVGLFGVIATLGLDKIIVRDIVHNPASQNEILGTAFILRLIGGILGSLLAIVFITLLRPGDDLIRWLVSILAAGLVFQSLDVIDLWFQSRVRSKYSVYAKSTAFLLVVLVKISLILNEAPLIAFVIAAFAEIVLGAIGLIIAYRMDDRPPGGWKVSFGRAKALIQDSWPLILSGLAIMVYMKIDQIMIGEMIGNKAVGIYSAATRVSEVWYFIPMAIVSSVTPTIIKAKENSEDFYYGHIRNLFYLVSALAFGIAIPMTFLSGPLIRVLFGESYSEAGTVLAIHIWAAIFVFLGVAQSPWTINEGLAKIALRRTVMGAIANVILNLVLIPRYSILGAAIATVISYALSAFVANAFDKRTRRIFWLQVESLVFSRYIFGKND